MIIYKARPSATPVEVWEIPDNIRLTVDTFEYSGTHMGERKVTATVESPTPIEFAIGDYFLFDTTYDNERLMLQTAPVVTRVYNSEMLSYSLTFWWAGYELMLVNFLDVVTGEPTQFYYSSNSVVSFEGNVESVLRRIKYNCHRAGYTAWDFFIDPAVDLTQYKTIVADNLKCWDVLQVLKIEFGVDFKFLSDVRTIIAGTSPDVVEYESLPVVFEYGKDKGLCEINRLQNDQKIITRLYAYGSERNLRPTYRQGVSGNDYHPRLMLPSVGQVGYTYYNALDGYIEITPLVNEYGVREDYYINDAIYPTIGEEATLVSVETVLDAPASDAPQYTKTLVTEGWTERVKDGDGLVQYILHEPVYKDVPVPTQDYSTFVVYVPDLGFDINSDDIKSTSDAKLSFLSGMLQGQEFTIARFEKNMVNTSGTLAWDNTYKVTLNRDTATKNYVLPNATVYPQMGDRFVYLDINLPVSYDAEAEQRLLEDAIRVIEERTTSPEGYSIKVPEEFVARRPGIEYFLKESNAVRFQDTLLSIPERTVLIQSITISYKADKLLPTYDLTVSDTPIKGYVQRVEAGLKSARMQVATVRSETAQAEQRQLKSASTLNRKMLNAAGDINGQIIAPQSVQVTALSPELRSTRYILEAAFRVNVGGDPNAALGSSGSITSKDMDMVWGEVYDAAHRQWTIATNQDFTIETIKKYFVYIQCSLSSSVALWLLSETRLGAQSQSGYFLFEWGVVLPVREGVRRVQSEYGEAAVVQDFPLSGIPYDLDFEFADIVAGTAKTYTLDIKAKKAYTIDSICLETDIGTLTGIAVKIGATNVTSLSSLTADTAVDETASTGANTVAIGDRVTISSSTGFTGTPTILRGKLIRTLA
jgi:hypothetical protein